MITERARVAAFLLAFSCLPLAAASFKVVQRRAASPPSFTIRSLGRLSPGASSQANAIDDRGDVVGIASVRRHGTPKYAWPSVAFLWRHGRMVSLGLPQGAASFAVDVNSSGQIAGGIQLADRQRNELAYVISVSHGHASWIRLPERKRPHQYGFPAAISRSGIVVGSAPPFHGQAVTWHHRPSGWTLDMPLGARGHGSDLVGIDNNGDVIGNVNKNRPEKTRAILWNGSGRVVLTGKHAEAYSAAHRVGRHHVLYSVGGASKQFPTYWYTPVEWSIRHPAGLRPQVSMVKLGLLPKYRIAQPTAVSSTGTAVGAMIIPTGGYGRLTDPQSVRRLAGSFGEGPGVLWLHRKAYRLRHLISNRSAWSQLYPTGINDKGQIVGIATYHGLDTAFLISPH